MYEIIGHRFSGKFLAGRFADEADAEIWVEDVFLPAANDSLTKVSARIVFNKAARGMPEFTII
jgi:hypothetical protein